MNRLSSEKSEVQNHRPKGIIQKTGNESGKSPIIQVKVQNLDPGQVQKGWTGGGGHWIRPGAEFLVGLNIQADQLRR